MDEIVVEIEHKLTGLAGTRIELVALKNGTARVQRDRDAHNERTGFDSQVRKLDILCSPSKKNKVVEGMLEKSGIPNNEQELVDNQPNMPYCCRIDRRVPRGKFPHKKFVV